MYLSWDAHPSIIFGIGNDPYPHVIIGQNKKNIITSVNPHHQNWHIPIIPVQLMNHTETVQRPLCDSSHVVVASPADPCRHHGHAAPHLADLQNGPQRLGLDAFRDVGHDLLPRNDRGAGSADPGPWVPATVPGMRPWCNLGSVDLKKG